MHGSINMIRTYCNVAAIYSLVGVVGWLVTVTSPYRYRVQFKNIIYYENG